MFKVILGLGVFEYRIFWDAKLDQQPVIDSNAFACPICIMHMEY